MVLPKSRKGWANSISPGAKVFMSLQVDGYIPKWCPRCGTKLNLGALRAEINWFVAQQKIKKQANRYSTTSGCWTAFQEARDSTSKVRREDAQPDLSDVAGNFNSSQAMDLKLFSRVHFPTANGASSMTINPGLHHFTYDSQDRMLSCLCTYIYDESSVQERLLSLVSRPCLLVCSHHSDIRTKL
jgi:hypothetical protein